ncbi:MAG: CRISPR-associated helicase Cas3' [Pseudomonadota bacterium]
MTDQAFDVLFRELTGHTPYPYQALLAQHHPFPSVLEIPTGLGKTEAVVLAWLYRRRFHPDHAVRRSTPRRLVYCLPMRVLVEQTVARIRQILAALEPRGRETSKEGIPVMTLMGGVEPEDWELEPERDQILVGTQDMLLSRALNRGYGMSRYRWPMHFGLLNSDCQWVMDEVQLMGNGLGTSAQLQAFRRLLGTAAPTRTLWMSATFRDPWLETVDFDRELDAGERLTLSDADLGADAIRTRWTAPKPLLPPISCSKTVHQEIAGRAVDSHHPGSLTLIVVNTVKRAQDVYKELVTRNKKNRNADLVLIHSRFRPPDRAATLTRLLGPLPEDGRIAVSTQVVEAGVDLSARLLITELAPWPSLVQRFGRCNRKGELQDQVGVVIVDVDRKAAAPYTADALAAAAAQLDGLEDVGLHSLSEREIREDMTYSFIPRRRDLLELFDTTPDLAGADIDVSRFIRDADDSDVQVFWRDFDGQPAPDESAPVREELCSISLSGLRKLLKKKGLPWAWRFDVLDRVWTKAKHPVPGMTLLLPLAAGGYHGELGWTGDPKHKPDLPYLDLRREMSANDTDPRSITHHPVTLAQHTDAVLRELDAILRCLDELAPEFADELRLAARWHDVGKAHPVFQEAVSAGAPKEAAGELLAKGARLGRYRRPGFRHELASALVMLDAGLSDLAVWLAAAHHGKVRLSLRSLPHEVAPEDPERRFARGLWEGDEIPGADLGSGEGSPAVTLNLSCMELGDGPRGPSWVSRMAALRDAPRLGPFRLAWLEALLRAADWRGSREEGEDE